MATRIALDFPESAVPMLHPDDPSINLQAVLRSDEIAPPQTLPEPSAYVPEVKQLLASRYFSEEFHRLEVERMLSY